MRYFIVNLETGEEFPDHVFESAQVAKAWLDYVCIADELYPDEQFLADESEEYRREHCYSNGMLKKAFRPNFCWKPVPEDLKDEGYIEIFYEENRGWYGFKNNDVIPSKLPDQGFSGGRQYVNYDEESRLFDIIETD